MNAYKTYELTLPNLPYHVVMEACWFHCDAEKWAYCSSIEINDVLVAEYNNSNKDAEDIRDDVSHSDLDISLTDACFLAHAVSLFIVERAIATYPRCSARDAYYGV